MLIKADYRNNTILTICWVKINVTFDYKLILIEINISVLE